jgi:hypothetical protein
MASSAILRRVALVRTDISEELSSSFIMVTRIGGLETTLAVTSNRSTLQRNNTTNVPNSPSVNLMMEAILSSETPILTTATLRNIPRDGILHIDHRENLKSYIALTGWAV